MGKRKSKFVSDIILGDRYVDIQTGFEGTATATYFFQYGCERTQIENYDAERKAIRNETFDAPRLTHIDTGKRARVRTTGGPGAVDEGARPEGNRATVGAR